MNKCIHKQIIYVYIYAVYAHVLCNVLIKFVRSGNVHDGLCVSRVGCNEKSQHFLRWLTMTMTMHFPTLKDIMIYIYIYEQL